MKLMVSTMSFFSLANVLDMLSYQGYNPLFYQWQVPYVCEMAIQFIDGKCHVMKRKSLKSALSGYYACVSCDLLLMPSGADTQTDTHIPTCKHKRFQETRLAQPSAMHAWFKTIFNARVKIHTL